MPDFALPSSNSLNALGQPELAAGGTSVNLYPYGAGASSSESTLPSLLPTEVQLGYLSDQAAGGEPTEAMQAVTVILSYHRVGANEAVGQPTSGVQLPNSDADSLLGPMPTLVQPLDQASEGLSAPALLGWSEVLDQAIALTIGQLQAFATEDTFADKVKLTFGEATDVEQVRALIATATNLADSANPLTRITVLTAPTLQISGGYAASTGTIYVATDFLAGNASALHTIAAVLLEELGHHFDAQLNPTDSPGDEGELFAALVQGQSIEAAEWIRLHAEDGTGTLYLNGQAILVEQSTGLTLIGDAGNNSLSGQGGNDWIEGRAGQDTLQGWDGADRLFGGFGNDDLRGGNGNDILRGEENNDVLVGGDGADDLHGQQGDDSLHGSEGFDTIVGGIGHDVLAGDAGNDSLWGEADNDQLYGHTGFDTLSGGDGNDFLTGWTETDYLYGGNNNDQLFGQQDDDQLFGDPGDDYLDGGSGNDVMHGGGENDTYIVDSGADQVHEAWNQGIDTVHTSVPYALHPQSHIEYLFLTGSAPLHAIGNDFNNWLVGNGSDNSLFGRGGNDTLQGGAGNDPLYGEVGDDHLHGEAGNDHLDGGSGNDVMVGGEGNDVYVVDSGADWVDEAWNQGIDWLHAFVPYALPAQAHIEYLALSGSAPLHAIGNDLNNWLVGNGADNPLFGRGGNDTLQGGAGNDPLYGEVGDDHLYGEAGHDHLDGGSGNDLMVGGEGNDVYVVDSAADQVHEAANQGSDTVQSWLSYSLPAQVEHLSLMGNSPIAGTGNELNNLIVGNSANNTLNGLGGTDTLQGGAGDDFYVVDSFDTVQENLNQGIDSVQSWASYSLPAHVENLFLMGAASVTGSGNELNNLIVGNDGNNSLNGRGGNDTLRGGIGNDVYFVDSSADVIQEVANQGEDTVDATASYTLPAHVENLVLRTSAIHGTGNNLDNWIYGSEGNNTISGLSGNDLLQGEGGNDLLQGSAGNASVEQDTLYGGSGADRFILGTASAQFYDDNNTATLGVSNYAFIADFNPTQGDVIELQGATISGSTRLSIQGPNAAAYVLRPSPAGLPQGIAIYRDKPGSEPDELIGIIQSPTNVNLTILKPPTIAANSDTGSSSTDGITRTATPTIQGEAAPGTSVTLRSGERIVGQAIADAEGRWSITTTALPDGTQTITATTTNAAGQTDPLSAPLTVVIDTTGPSLSLTPLGKTPLSSASRLTGTVADNGSAVAALAYRFNNAAPIALNFSAGRFDQAIDLTGVPAGIHTLTVLATDVAGNTTTTAMTVAVNTPTLSGTTIATSTLQASLAQDTGVVSGDGITTNPEITGQVLLAGTGVELAATFGDPSLDRWTTLSLNPDRSFTLALAQLSALNGGNLPDGNYVLHLRTKSAQGTWSAPQPLRFQLDRLAPQLQVSGLIDGVTWRSGRETLSGKTDADAQVQYRVGGQSPVGLPLAATGEFSRSVEELPTTPGIYEFAVTSTDLAGNEQTVQYNFLVKDTSRVTDDDWLSWMPPEPDPGPTGGPTPGGPGSNAPLDPNGNWWGFVGLGGTWGFSTGNGNWQPNLGGAGGPGSGPGTGPGGNNCQDYPYSSGFDEGIGYSSFDLEISDIVTAAYDAISSHPSTASKKAALWNRQHVIKSIASWLRVSAETLNDTQDRLLANRMKPALNGIFYAAFDSITKTCQAKAAGYDLAVEIVKNPSAVRVRVYEAALMAVVAKVLTQRGDAVSETDYQSLTAALLQLSETYVKLNPNPEPGGADLLYNFLDPLWRIQSREYSTQWSNTTLDKSAAALVRLLEGVDDPVAALKFINNLIQATTEVVSLNQQSSHFDIAAVKDAQFLRELVAFGFQYAKLNPIDHADAVNDGTAAFLNTIKKAHVATETAKQQATGKFSDLFKGLDSNQKRVQMVEFTTNLLKATKLSPTMQTKMYDPKVAEALVYLGNTYTKSSFAATESEESSIIPFLDVVWKSQADTQLEEAAEGMQKLIQGFADPAEVLQFANTMLQISELAPDVRSKQLIHLPQVNPVLTPLPPLPTSAFYQLFSIFPGDTPRFIQHYYEGGGAPVDLADWGLLETYRNAPDVQRGTNMLRYRAVDSINRQAFTEDVPTQITGSFSGSVNATFVIFSMGSSNLVLNYTATLDKSQPIYGRYTSFPAYVAYPYTLELRYSVTDRFVDALDELNLIPGNQEFPGNPVPYDLTVSWTTTQAGVTSPPYS